MTRKSTPRIPESVQLEKLAAIATKRYTYERIGEYQGTNKTRYLCTCLIDGYQWEAGRCDLLRGKGCRLCGIKNNALSQIRPEQDLSQELAIATTGKCTFRRVGEYLGLHKTRYSCVCLSCEVEWETRSTSLLAGKGCPECGKRLIGERLMIPEGIAVSKAKDCGFILSGWLVEYFGLETPALWLCHQGHEFEVSPSKFIHAGQGCPSCADYGYSPSKPGTLYALRSSCASMVKIGISNNPEQRHRQLERATPFEWDCIERVECEDGAVIAQLEKRLHSQMEQIQFDESFDGSTEWFKYTEAVPVIFESLRQRLHASC